MRRLGWLIGLVAMVTMVLAVAPAANAQQFIGRFCFTYDSFSDLWILNVEAVGSDTFQLMGQDPTYEPEFSSINGGGFVKGGKFYGNMLEARVSSGRRTIHDFLLDLATMHGQDWMSWHNPDGTNHVTHMGIGFQLVSCPAAGEAIKVAGPTTDPR